MFGTYLPAFLEEEAVTPNMLWLVSLDGPREVNDARRGPGMFDNALKAMDALRERGIPFGFSITLSHDNVVPATEPDFIASLVAHGCRNGFLLEQIPHSDADSPLSIQIAERLALCRRELSLPIVGFPGDEVRYGGCQAGGEGIAHVSPDGYLEPCPAARLAVNSLADVSLEAALSSPFFKEFREMKERIGQEGEACSYNGRSEAFQRYLSPLGARSTV